jgi:ribosome-binding protein aMBF1 (putative translation factor)
MITGMETKVAPSPLGSDHAAVAAARAGDPSYRAARLRFAVAEKVARLLIGFRQQHGLTQAQLGAALGMKESAVSRLESGEHVPNFATLGRIAECCSVDVVLDFADRAPDASANRREVVLA